MLSQQMSEFESRLTEMTTVLSELVSCLREEREAMVESDLEKIARTQAKKQDVISSLQRIDHSYRESLQVLAPSAALQDRLSCIRSLAQVVSEFHDLQCEVGLPALP